MQQTPRSRYRFEGGKACIDINIKSESQLFDARDPAPFRERDLDDDFVEYIVTSVEELGRKSDFKIKLNIAEQPAQQKAHEIIVAIRTFFDWQAEILKLNIRKSMRNAQLFLITGVVVLVLCLLLSGLAADSNVLFVRTVLKEGLVIGGWVAMWRPLEAILYDWWPVWQRVTLFKKISEVEIEIG